MRLYILLEQFIIISIIRTQFMIIPIISPTIISSLWRILYYKSLIWFTIHQTTSQSLITISTRPKHVKVCVNITRPLMTHSKMRQLTHPTRLDDPWRVKCCTWKILPRISRAHWKANQDPRTDHGLVRHRWPGCTTFCCGDSEGQAYRWAHSPSWRLANLVCWQTPRG